MKIYLTIILSYVLSLAPISALPALAAYNDVELTTSAEISISSVTLTVSGSSAFGEQLDVDSESFTLIMPANSYVKVASTDKRTIAATELGSITRKFTCGSSESTLEVSNPATGVSVTPTFTVSSSACTGGSGGTTGSSGGSSSGGSSSGGGSSAPTVPAVTTPAPAVAKPSPIALAVSPVFNSNLALGARNDDVKRVQQLLNSDPDTKIAESGAGSPGNETNYFGPATRNAIGKFQIKYGLVKNSSEAGYGNLGPKTRGKLNEVFGKGVPATTPVAPTVAQPSSVAVSVSPVFNSDLNKGMRNNDVSRLQELLATDSSIYPDGTVSGLFGPLTEQAVKKFQAKYSLPQVGRVGPATRAKLEEVFGKKSVTPAPVVAPAPVVPPTPVYIGPAPAVPVNPNIPYWLQLTPATPGGASIVDPKIDPTSPESNLTVEEKLKRAQQLPDWMRLTPSN
ncbi:MAG TPA: peptidoglycan-binding domain-containing protein [Candidatus Paceibacterota bacterium]